MNGAPNAPNEVWIQPSVDLLSMYELIQQIKEFKHHFLILGMLREVLEVPGSKKVQPYIKH